MAQTIVFDIGGMRFRAGLVDEAGKVSQAVAFDSPTHPDEVVEHISRIVDSYAVTAKEAAVGIAIGGMVETNGKVTAGTINMFDYPLAQRLGLRRPVTVINDAKAAALAEARYNTRLTGKNFVLLTVSAGIGGGIIIDGGLYAGHTGTAGEVGHMIIDRGQDAYCRLGHRGCLDALASARALNNRIMHLWRAGHWAQFADGLSLDDLPPLLAVGDGLARRLVREAGMWLGTGVMNLIRVLDPCEIVFKGYLVTSLWTYLLPAIEDVLAGYDRCIPMSLCSLGEHVGLVGAGLAAQEAHAAV
jgi:glucokinase